MSFCIKHQKEGVMNQFTNQATNTVNLDAGLTSPVRTAPIRTTPIKNALEAKLENKLTPFTQSIYPSFSSPAKHTASFGVINRQTAKHWHFLDGQDELTRSFELIKVLRQHQADKRWTLLIAPSHIPDKALLDCCSVDMRHVLIVREKQITSMSKTIEKALNCRTCSAIVAWCSEWHKQLSNVQLQQLSKLADAAQCHVYAFNKQFANKVVSASNGTDNTNGANRIVEH